MLSCMNDVALMSYAAVTMRHYPSKDTRTLVACVRHLQDSHERWTVPTIMCDCRRVGRSAGKSPIARTGQHSTAVAVLRLVTLALSVHILELNTLESVR